MPVLRLTADTGLSVNQVLALDGCVSSRCLASHDCRRVLGRAYSWAQPSPTLLKLVREMASPGWMGELDIFPLSFFCHVFPSLELVFATEGILQWSSSIGILLAVFLSFNGQGVGWPVSHERLGFQGVLSESFSRW